MQKSIKVEVEGNEISLKNSHGDIVIIPKNKTNWVKQKLSEGCHGCIDGLVESLPSTKDYAGDGTVIPGDKKIKVNNPDGSQSEYSTNSPEYKKLYDSGRLATYDKSTDTYIMPLLEEVTITAEAPQWLKDKREYEKTYTKQQFVSEYLPKWARAIGETTDNLSKSSQTEYDKRINDKVVENIFKRKPTFDDDYSNNRLKTLQGFSQKELELIKNSSYSSKIEPSIWSKFEQGLLSVGNAFSPVQFKNSSLSPEEAKEEDTPLNILQPLAIPSKMVQSIYKKDYSFKDALKGKANNAGIGEDIITDPLNLVGLGIWNKLSKANKFAKIEDAYQAVKGLSKEEELIDLYRIQEKQAKTFAQLSQEGKIPKVFNTPEVLARKANEEKYFGQWFTKDKADLDFYKGDREFINPEIINLKVPKSKLEQYQQYDKTLSRAPDREFVIPQQKQDLYKQIEVLKSNFQSEINWGNFNKEIPDNPTLLKEYNTIEQTAKQNGSWMKNTDGSKFIGTPEQFVQQQSGNFKKAYKEGFDKTYRGDSNFFDEFKKDREIFTSSSVQNASHYTAANDPSFWNLNEHKIGQNVKFTIPHDSKLRNELVKEASKTKDWHKVVNYDKERIANSNSGGLRELYSPKSKNSLEIDGKGNEWTNVPYEGKEMLTDFVAEDLFNKNLDYININNIRDPHLENLKILNPNRINPKSAIGNNGMFDMTNPNIYKALIPPVIIGTQAIKNKKDK